MVVIYLIKHNFKNSRQEICAAVHPSLCTDPDFREFPELASELHKTSRDAAALT